MPKRRKDAAHVENGLPVTPPHIWGNHENNVGADYSDEEREFAVAMERYRRERRRPCPTCRETLLVLKALGYRRPDATAEGQTVTPGGGSCR